MHTRSRALLAVPALLGLLAMAPATRAGCLVGAAAGAVAGHYAHHHAVLGAVGGCIVGHHLAVKKKRTAEARKLIADYSATGNAARKARDARAIDKLARKKVPLAVQWEAQQR